MRYMILIAADEKVPMNECDDDIAAAYVKYTEDLRNAGVLLGGDALQGSARGARVTVEGGRRAVTDGPFAEAKEVIGGYYVISVKSREEAIEWAARCPAARHAPHAYVEVREVMEFPS